MTAASAELNVGVSALSGCVNGITAQAGGWKWRFASKVTATALKMGVRGDDDAVVFDTRGLCPVFRLSIHYSCALLSSVTGWCVRVCVSLFSSY